MNITSMSKNYSTKPMRHYCFFILYIIPYYYSGQSDSQHQYFNHPHQQQQQQIYQQQNQIQQFQNYQKQQQQQQSGPVQYQPEVIRINQVNIYIIYIYIYIYILIIKGSKCNNLNLCRVSPMGRSCRLVYRSQCHRYNTPSTRKIN